MSRYRRGRVAPLVRVLCASAALLLLSWRSDARSLSFRRIGVREGLSRSSVYCVLQDRQGFVWIGTEDGLNRYDGNRFKVYRSDPSDPGSLSCNTVTSLREDRLGCLWVDSLAAELDIVRLRKGSS